MSRKIDLRSDTVTRPGPAMRKAIAEAEVGDDVFGDDPTVLKLERMLAEMVGMEAALFLPSGTMSNQTAIVAHTQPGDEIICDVGCHLYNFESSGPAVHAHVIVTAVEGHHGALTADMVRRRIRPINMHQPRTRLVCLENTHNRAGGRIYPVELMRGVSTVAREHELRLHLDGARLFNAAIARGIPVTEWTSLVDSVNICLSKGLGAPIGSMLAGPVEFIERARWIRKRMGGGMRQVGILAAAGIYALQNHIPRLAEDHANARRLAEGLFDLPGLDVRPQETETNIVIIRVKETSRYSATELLALLAEKSVLLSAFGEGVLRAVTHLDVNEADIDRAVEACRKLLAA
jgi:threonine aldolase